MLSSSAHSLLDCEPLYYVDVVCFVRYVVLVYCLYLPSSLEVKLVVLCECVGILEFAHFVKTFI